MNQANLRMTISKIEEIIRTLFYDTRTICREDLVFHDSVREMCQQNQCGAYGKNWMCPPAMGSMETCKRMLARFHAGWLVQTVGQLEDAFDYPTMLKTENTHNRNLHQAKTRLQKEGVDVLVLGAGGCRICKTCSYPHHPCRFPERAYHSMEGVGLLVTDVCKQVSMPYHYGKNTVTYTGCLLL